MTYQEKALKLIAYICKQMDLSFDNLKKLIDSDIIDNKTLAASIISEAKCLDETIETSASIFVFVAAGGGGVVNKIVVDEFYEDNKHLLDNLD